MITATLNPTRSSNRNRGYMNAQGIGHAIAYCEIVLCSRSDPAELPEFRMIMEYKRILSIESIVRILKETVDQRDILPEERYAIKREMDRVEFRQYLEDKLGV